MTSGTSSAAHTNAFSEFARLPSNHRTPLLWRRCGRDGPSSTSAVSAVVSSTAASVGVFVDDVYLGHTAGTLAAWRDIERVEVLKGRKARFTVAIQSPALST